jgi:purine-binding chemotaxis protein CheW
VDLRRRLGLPTTEYGTMSRIVVVEVNERTIGFTVDRVNEVLRISSGIVDAAPGVVTRVDSQFIAGIGKLEDRLVILLDLDKLLSVDELRGIEQSLQAAA